MPPRRPIHALLARLALALGGLCVALGLAEGAVRLWPLPGPSYPVERLPPGEGCFEDHLTLGYTGRAGACGRDARGYFTVQTPGEGPTLDVLLVGDSLSERPGWLALALAESGARHGVPTRLRSAGVMGYDACQGLERLRLELEAQAPELVVVQACSNDLLGSAVLTRGPDGRARFHGPAGVVTLPAALLRSRLLTWLWVVGPLARPLPAVRTPGVATEAEVAAQRACHAELGRLRQASEVPIVAVAFPVLVDVAADAPEWTTDLELRMERQVLASLQASGLPTLDLRPGLAAQGSLRSLRRVASDHLHPAEGEAAHRIAEVVGPWIEPWLVDRGS